ncbi:MAG: endonuclease MutS2 [Candidatus Zixiibacteriota bacterium]
MSDGVIASTQVQAILEFDKIVAATEGLCLTPMGKEALRRRQPTADIERIDRLREEVREMLTVLRTGAGFPIVRVPDIRPFIERAGLEGSFLEPGQFLQIGEFLSAIDELLRFSRVSEVAFPRLEAYLEGLSAVYPLRTAIDRAISPEADVRDNASPELKRIRKERRGARDAVVARLERMLDERSTDPSRMDDLITLRNDRFVIPMREGDPRANDGVIQDRSSSGATLYVEPMKVVELNNRLRRLSMEESREVERILRGLTDMVRENRFALTDDSSIYGDLDAVHATAQFGVNTNGNVVNRLDAAEIDLVDARHPLLVLQAREQRRTHPDDPPMDVVPMSVSLGRDTSTIIITGPNTGGKTVALKTIGLLVLMAQAGWPIPAKENSKVGVFTRLIADIGDEQSIESSLSTFSSHLARINDALRTADDRSLVLLDELGAGTDPKEGAALGEAIVLELTERGARLIVTTHHTALKTLAQQSAHIANAALEFDPSTLSPTYRFRVGLPGASYAIDIARRLGLPDHVTKRAESLVDAQEKDLSRLLIELDERLMSVRNREAELDKSTKAAAALEDLFRARMAKIEQLEKEKKSEALAQAESIVQNTRREMERLVKEIRESQAERQRVKETHRALADTARKIKDERREVAPQPEQRPKRQEGPLSVGDRVWIESFKREAEVVTIDDDKEQVKVQLGDFLYTIDRDAVERIESKPVDDSKRVKITVKGGHGVPTSEVGPEISLRGLSAEDALEVLDRYLDEARLAGWNEVRIVHGKGEGILRRAVGEYLSRDARVVEKRLGHWNEGGDGVTLAKLTPES